MHADHMFPQKVRRKSNPRKARVVELKNAKLMALEYPDTFHLPAASSLKKLKVGDWVKVSIPQERFWVKVSGFEGRKWFGQIANDLIFSDLKLGDTIQFYKKNIYDLEYQ